MITPGRAIDQINGRFGRHPGHRALHAKGILCRGTLTATPAAAARSRAAHLQGADVPITVRFSNGSGDPNHPDYAPAVHADALTSDDTDWRQIVQLYDQLLVLRPDVVVGLNRAIAVGELQGPEAGLHELEALDATVLDDYQPYHATRADLLARSGRDRDAAAAYVRAQELSVNPRERSFLAQRFEQLPSSG